MRAFFDAHAQAIPDSIAEEVIDNGQIETATVPVEEANEEVAVEEQEEAKPLSEVLKAGSVLKVAGQGHCLFDCAFPFTLASVVLVQSCLRLPCLSPLFIPFISHQLTPPLSCHFGLLQIAGATSEPG